MLCLLDVPIFIDSRPQTSWGHANGKIDLPEHPAGRDRISIPHGIPELVRLGLQDPTPVMGVSELDGLPVVLFDGVVAPDEQTAARAAWLLSRRLGFDVSPHERSATQAWFTARGGLHDARITGVEARGANVVLTLDDEWANEPEAQLFGGPGDLIVGRPQLLAGDLAKSDGGWISEAFIDGDRLVIDFCDRERLEIACADVRWSG